MSDTDSCVLPELNYSSHPHTPTHPTCLTFKKGLSNPLFEREYLRVKSKTFYDPPTDLMTALALRSSRGRTERSWLWFLLPHSPVSQLNDSLLLRPGHHWEIKTQTKSQLALIWWRAWNGVGGEFCGWDFFFWVGGCLNENSENNNNFEIRNSSGFCLFLNIFIYF